MPSIEPMHLAVLFVASLAAGVVNALAGGGSLVTLPVLLGLGLPPVVASGTNAVAAWSGLLGGALRCRSVLAPHAVGVRAFAVLSAIGGAIGGGLVILAPRGLLETSMPWMILAATVCFLVVPWIREWIGGGDSWTPGDTADVFGWRGAVHGLASILTGFFNPAGGVAMVAAFQAFGVADLALATALKIVLGMAMTGASVAVFVSVGAVSWPLAAVMIAGTVAGGWIGAAIALAVDARLLRGTVLAWGGAMSAMFLFHA